MIAYSRQISSPDDLINRLVFTQTDVLPIILDGAEDNASGPVQGIPHNAVFQGRFVERIHEFLRQPGYTQNTINLFANPPSTTQEDQSVLRARLLLRAATGSELLPVEDDGEAITV